MPERFWEDAREKVEREGRCRSCRAPVLHLDAAHVLGRSLDARMSAVWDELGLVFDASAVNDRTLYVHPLDVVPLCRRCHLAYDTKQLDLLPVLTLAEQARAAGHVGLERALHRTAPLAWQRA